MTSKRKSRAVLYALLTVLAVHVFIGCAAKGVSFGMEEGHIDPFTKPITTP